MTAATQGQAFHDAYWRYVIDEFGPELADSAPPGQRWDDLAAWQQRATEAGVKAAIAARQPQPAPGDTSAIVDRAVKEWLDRHTATALATAPGIDDREQGKRQGIEQLRYGHLDDYWYVLTPAILAALGKEPQPAPGVTVQPTPEQVKQLAATLRRISSQQDAAGAAEAAYATGCAATMVEALIPPPGCGCTVCVQVGGPHGVPQPAPELAAAMAALSDAIGALNAIALGSAKNPSVTADKALTAIRKQLAGPETGR